MISSAVSLAHLVLSILLLHMKTDFRNELFRQLLGYWQSHALAECVGRESDSHFLLRITHLSSTDFQKGRDLKGEFDEANPKECLL